MRKPSKDVEHRVLDGIKKEQDRWAASFEAQDLEVLDSPDMQEEKKQAELKNSILSYLWFWPGWNKHEEVITYYKRVENGHERRCDIVMAMSDLKEEGRIFMKRFGDGLYVSTEEE